MKLQVAKHPHVHSMAHALALQPVMPHPPQWHHRRDMWLAVIVTAGVFMGFLSVERQSGGPPFSGAPGDHSGGRILGSSISVPLVVNVILDLGATSWTTTAQPRQGRPIEVLASLAAQTQTSLVYSATDSSIVLRNFLNLESYPGATWHVFVNGQEATDLSQPSLQQGDTISLNRS